LDTEWKQFVFIVLRANAQAFVYEYCFGYGRFGYNECVVLYEPICVGGGLREFFRFGDGDLVVHVRFRWVAAGGLRGSHQQHHNSIMNLTRLAECLSTCECKWYFDDRAYVGQVWNGFHVIWALIREALFLPGRPLAFLDDFFSGRIEQIYTFFHIPIEINYEFQDRFGQGTYINGTYREFEPEIIKACALRHIDSIWYAIAAIYIWALVTSVLVPIILHHCFRAEQIILQRWFDFAQIMLRRWFRGLWGFGHI
jgi:hypothetical protein